MAKAPPPTLLEHAVAALQDIHAVQVGLAQAHADPDALKQVGAAAALFATIVKALGAGPALDNAGAPQAGPPQPGEPDADDVGPAGPPPGPPQAAPAPAPQAAPPSGGHGGPMLAAAKVLQAAHAAANAKP